MTQILDALFSVYAERVTDVNKITRAMVEKGIVNSQDDIINDQINSVKDEVNFIQRNINKATKDD